MADAQGLGSPSPHLGEQDLYIKIRRACFGTWERPGDFLLLFDFSLGSGGPRSLQRNATHLHPHPPSSNGGISDPTERVLGGRHVTLRV